MNQGHDEVPSRSVDAAGSEGDEQACSREEDCLSAGHQEAGQAITIEHLIAQHHLRVYRYAYRLSGNSSDAEDLTQQTFLIAHQKLDQLRDDGRAGAWLFTICRSCFLKSLRKRTPASAGDLSVNLETLVSQSDTGPTETEELQLALNALSPEFRMVVVMFYFDELSYKEIAATLTLPIGTVMSRLARAKRQLRGLLERLADPSRHEPASSQ